MLGPNFRRMVTASGCSNLADGMFLITLPLVALTVTRNAAAFASVTVVGRLPWLIFALPAGALADRLDRRRTMTLVNAGRAIVIGTLALIVAADAVEMWMLYLIAFTLGCGETLFDTAAQSVLPTIVDADQLDRANGRLYATETVSNLFVGPPLGAFLAGVTLAGAVGSTSALYVVAAVVLLTMHGHFRAERSGPPTRIWHDVKEGVRYLVHHRLLRLFALCVGVSNLGSTMTIAILPLYMIDPGPIGLSKTGYGIAFTCLAAGSVVGTFFVDRVNRRLGLRLSLLLATFSFPLFSLVPALTTSVPVIFVSFVVFGAISIIWNVLTVSLRQRIVPDQMLGRLNASYRLVAWGTMPLGAALGGLIAAGFGLRATLLTSALVSAVCFPLILFGTTRQQLANAGAAGET